MSFNFFVKNGSFESLIKIINSSKNDEELVKNAESWLPDIIKYDIDYWRQNIYFDNITKININRLPKVIEVFYKSNDKFKFMIGCMILESTIDRLPYVPDLSNITLFVEKWKILKEFVCTIISKSNSLAITKIYDILLKNDPEGTYLTLEDKNSVIERINNQLELSYDCIVKYDNDSKLFVILEKLIDISKYYFNENTKVILNKLFSLDISDELNVISIKYRLLNDIQVDYSVIDKVLKNESVKYKFFVILDSLGKLDILGDRIRQDDIAVAAFRYWVVTKTRCFPTGIELIDTIEDRGLLYFLYKFKLDNAEYSKNGYMIGVAGGYEKEKITTKDSGIITSVFDPLEADYRMQGIKLIGYTRTYLQDKNK